MNKITISDIENVIFGDDYLTSYTVDLEAKAAYSKAETKILRLKRQGKIKSYKIDDPEKPLSLHEISVTFADQTKTDGETSASVPTEMKEIIDLLYPYIAEKNFMGTIWTNNNESIELIADVIIYHEAK